MKTLSLFVGLVFAARAVCVANPAAEVPPELPASTNIGPKIQFEAPVFDFGRVKVGEVVKHTFIFTNIGDQVLELKEVRPSCGCTGAGEWSRKVEPGQTGSIPLQLGTAGFGGPISKPITVTCNDPSQPSVVLQMKGTVWKPIDVAPQFAVMHATAHSTNPVSTLVRIVNNEEEPVTISEPELNHPSFTAELKEVKPGMEFELTVRTAGPLPPGNVQGGLLMKTSSPQVPVINVNFLAMVQEMVAVAPAEILIPAVPATSVRAFAVSVRNNSPILMKLSDPSVNAAGVDVQMLEVEPGRQFTLTVMVPSEFAVKEGEKVELTVKSDHPQYPALKVPIRMHAPPPAPVMIPISPPAQPAAARQSLPPQPPPPRTQ
jgi:hypothetical protein